MNAKFTEEKLIEVYCSIDDSVKMFERWARENLPGGPPRFAGGLSGAEVLTILVMYHHSGYKCFEYYYNELVAKQMKSHFPGIVTHKRFLSLIPRALPLALAASAVRGAQAAATGIYFADSTPLPVCHNRRIHSNRVFKDAASRGKSSTGWFYGLKLHLAVNHLGQPVRWLLTGGSVADNDKGLMRRLFAGLKGRLFADKGYISGLFREFAEAGLTIVTKAKKNMKPRIMTLEDRLLLKKRGIIESAYDILKTVCDIEHTRHRSPVNAAVHVLCGVLAYSFIDSLPSLVAEKFLLGAV